jgi:hypothetical protein
MSSEQIKAVLESVARECSDLNKHEVIVVEVLEVLERRLLPLLEAGAAMHTQFEQFAGGPITVTREWDAAMSSASQEKP